MTGSSFSMLEIEEELKKDVRGTFARDIQDRLYRYLAEVKGWLDRGLGPDEFAKARHLNEAIRESIKVVDAASQAFHRLN